MPYPRYIRKYYKYGEPETNINKVGNPTINGSIVSNFTDNDYIQLPQTFQPSSSTWEIVIKFKGDSGHIIGDTSNDAYKNVRIWVVGVLQVALNSSGSQYFWVSNGTTTIDPNKWYWLKLSYNSSNIYELLLSEDGINYNLETSSSATSTKIRGNVPVYLGARAISTGNSFNGSIDLLDSYAKINGTKFWTGATRPIIPATEDDYDFYEDELAPYPTRTVRKYYKYEEIPFIQPILTKNGTIGGNEFAVYVSLWETGNYPWHMFDGNLSTRCSTYGVGLPDLIFYNPETLLITNILFTWTTEYGDTYLTATIQGSNDNVVYEDLATFTKGASASTTSVDIPNYQTPYKYYRMHVPSSTGTTYWDIKEITITATQTAIVPATEDDYDFYEDVEEPIPMRCKKVTETTRYYYKYEDWEQPILTQSGTMGEDDFACSALVNPSSAYRAFDNDNNTYWTCNGNSDMVQWVSFYNKERLVISNLKIGQNTSERYYYIKDCQIQGSNDNINWHTICEVTGQSYQATLNIDVNSTKGYKYHRIYITNRAYYASSDKWCPIYYINITAREAIEATEDDYDFYEDVTETTYSVPKVMETIRHYYKYETQENLLLNPDGLIKSQNGGEGWVIYPSTDYGEFFRCLNASFDTAYPRWQTQGIPRVAYFKIPYNSIITSYIPTQWVDKGSTLRERLCTHWRITGYSTEEDMLAMTNGTVIDDNTWDTWHSNGYTKTVDLSDNTNKLQYYTLEMLSRFSGGNSYTSIGNIKFYATSDVPVPATEDDYDFYIDETVIKYYGLLESLPNNIQE